jgi:hypothetical protein
VVEIAYEELDKDLKLQATWPRFKSVAEKEGDRPLGGVVLP